MLNFIEATLLAILWPSTLAKRTIFLGVYRLYTIWAELSELATEYVEQPFFKDWALSGGYMFHCNFDNVDVDQFPNSMERIKQQEHKFVEETKSVF